PVANIRIEIPHALKQGERREQRTLRIVAVRRGVAEIDEEAVAEGLRDESPEAFHGHQGQSLIATQKLPEIFGVQLFGQVCEPDQVDELDGEKGVLGRRRARPGCPEPTHRTPPPIPAGVPVAASTMRARASDVPRRDILTQLRHGWRSPAPIVYT